MIVTVTLGGQPTVSLDDPDDFTRFHVAAHGPRDRSRLDTALAEAGAALAEAGAALAEAGAALAEGGGAEPDGEDVRVSVAWLRAQAAGRAGPDWERGFASMLDYAERKGWTDAARTSVQAHVEWDQ